VIDERKDLDLLIKATESVRDFVSVEALKHWIEMPRNRMFVEGDSVGLATYEYPGLYSVHWYFKVRGKDAINLGKRMIAHLFNHSDAKAIRGLIKTRLKAARWAARQVHFTSVGVVTYPDGDENELFCMTKDEFFQKENGE
jgi:hypothetical protein